MKRFNSFILIFFLAFGLFSLNSCKNKGCTEPTAVNYDPDATENNGDCTFPQMSLMLNALVGDEPLTLGDTYTINGTKVQIDVAQFYVSGIRLGATGIFDEPAVYLLMKGDQSIYELGEITVGEKLQLLFNVGVDSAANHADPTTYEATHPLAPQNPNMHWSWDNGYIFIKIEGSVDTDGDGTPESRLEYHIGKDANLQSIVLSVNKTVEDANPEISLNVDFGAFFDGMNLTDEAVLITHTGDFPSVAGKVAENTQKVFSVTQ